MSETEHPEQTCELCGGVNISWSAPSPLWNEVMRNGDINNITSGEIVCPVCFAKRAEKLGIAMHFRLYSPDVKKELSYITPSGRVWNNDKWLWEAPTTNPKKSGE